MLIDTHCHLSELSEQEIAEQLHAAHEAGVSRIIVIGSGHGMVGVKRTIDIVKDNFGTLRRHVDTSVRPHLSCALGVHPHEAKEMTDENFETIKKLIAGESKVVGIGEVGLDYHYLHSPKDVQHTVFARFLNLAREIKKPVMIHDREAGDDCINLIKQEGRGALTGQAHCFSGDWALAQKYLDLGFYISVTGVITFPKATDLREVIKKIPLDRLLVETDSPFLTPVPFRGKKNQPAYVRYVVEELAKLKGISFEEMAKVTMENAGRLYRFS